MTPIWRNTLTFVGATTLTFGMAHAQSPELSDPPEIEGEVVGDHGYRPGGKLSAVPIQPILW